MRSYQASGIAPIPSTILTAIIGATIAFIVGWLLFIFDHTGFFLIVIFPLGAAVMVGFSISKMIELGKIRNAKVAGSIGLIAGLIAVGSYFGLGYTVGFKSDVQELAQSFRQSDNNTLDPKEAAWSEAVAAQTADMILQSYVGQTGFMGYLNYRAKEGTSVGIRRLTLFHITGFFYWILKLVEMGIIVFGAYALAAAAAGEPFDEHNQQWYGKKAILFSSDANLANVNKALRQGNFEDAATQLSSPSVAAPYITLSSRTVANGKPSKIVLELDEVSLDSKGNESSKMLERGLVSGEQFDRLMAGHTSSNPPKTNAAVQSVGSAQVGLPRQAPLGVTPSSVATTPELGRPTLGRPTAPPKRD